MSDEQTGRSRSGEPDTFRVLYVCTGNICRSPFAELLMTHLLLCRLGGAATIHVAGAGTDAAAGSPIHPATRDELVSWGLTRATTDQFAARRLDLAMVEQADLVLGATPRHRSAAVLLAPSALATAFGLREFARLAASVDPTGLPADALTRARRVVGHARARRGLEPPLDPGSAGVPDPMGRPQAAHHAAALLISEAVHTVVDLIAPLGPHPRQVAEHPGRHAGVFQRADRSNDTYSIAQRDSHSASSPGKAPG